MSGRALTWGIAAALAAAALHAFDPSDSSLFPPCPTRAVFDVLCPGCGSQRVLHHLLHGRIAEAWSLNPAAVLAVPYGGAGWVAASRAPTSRSIARFRRTCYGRSASLLTLVGLLAWSVFRNFG